MENKKSKFKVICEKLRERHGENQAEMAERVYIPASTLSNFERSRQVMSGDQVRLFCERYNLSDGECAEFKEAVAELNNLALQNKKADKSNVAVGYIERRITFYPNGLALCESTHQYSTYYSTVNAINFKVEDIHTSEMGCLSTKLFKAGYSVRIDKADGNGAQEIINGQLLKDGRRLRMTNHLLDLFIEGLI